MLQLSSYGKCINAAYKTNSMNPLCVNFLKQALVSFLIISFAKKTLNTLTAFMICYLKESWFLYVGVAHKNLGLPNSNGV